ncbi:MAG: hypothetical protein FJ010_11540 [Chloroflexi bacterium]|nr:hypothetical protein [Chloroflexota bacterium]
MERSKVSWFPVVIGMIMLLAISTPYLYAANAGGDEYIFGGFLFNPLDNNTYLAKIYQGWEGDWRNQMAYSADPGEGAYINLYYLFLGHVARFSSLPLIFIFHAARLIGAAALSWTLWRFFGVLFRDQRPRKLAFALSLLGSGLGWALILSGLVASDLWVAEMYPFLASATNPHFPLGLTLMLWLIALVQRDRSFWQSILRVFLAWALSVVSPFGLAVVLGILGCQFLYEFVARRAWQNLASMLDDGATILLTLIGGSPAMLYYLWVSHADPIVAAWNAQNVTLSPPLWDLLLSLSPALLLAIVGAWKQIKPGKHHEAPLLLIWAGMSLFLVYTPFDLQRRFLMGIFIPLAGLAALGLEHLVARFSWSFRSWAILLFALSLPTNLVVLLTSFHGVQTHQSVLYLTRDEAVSLEWIVENTPSDALILASPGLGNFIPAHTGRRVIYGHPFETINAEQEEKIVEQLFEGELPFDELRTYLDERGVGYIFCGPREQGISAACLDWDYEAVFSDGQVNILATGN